MDKTDSLEIPKINRTRKASDRERNPKQENEDTTPKKPWEDPEVSERVLKSVLIKMPEPLKIKLDYVLDHSPGRQSMQGFILELVRNAVEKKLANLDAK